MTQKHRSLLLFLSVMIFNTNFAMWETESLIQNNNTEQQYASINNNTNANQQNQNNNLSPAQRVITKIGNERLKKIISTGVFSVGGILLNGTTYVLSKTFLDCDLQEQVFLSASTLYWILGAYLKLMYDDEIQTPLAWFHNYFSQKNENQLSTSTGSQIDNRV